MAYHPSTVISTPGEDLKRGARGQEKLEGSALVKQARGPRSGASGADTKNKVAAVCFLCSALPLLLFFASAALYPLF